MLNETERKILQVFAKRHVIRRSELKSVFDGNATGILNSLIEKGLIVEVTPIGERAFAITQKGLKVLSELEM
jgi:chromosome segregation and condensation protein ScpB